MAKGLALAALCLAIGLPCAGSFAGPSDAAEIGQCRLLLSGTTPKAKHGKYADGDCLTLFEKNGRVKAKGNYEWFPGPEPSCVPEKHGVWANASCTQEAAKPGKGSFEREECYGSGNGCAEYSSSSGKVELQTIPFTNPIECTTGTDFGTLTSSDTGVDTVTFKNCSSYHDEYTCYWPSPGGEIASFGPLETALSTHDTRGGQQAWIKLSGTNGQFGPLAFAIVCQYLPTGQDYALEVRGSVSGPLEPLNVMTKTFTEGFSNGLGEQNFTTRTCLPPCVEAADVLTATVTLTTSTPYEIKP